MNDEQFDNFKLNKNILKAEDVIEHLQDLVNNSKLLLGYFKVFNLIHHLDKNSIEEVFQFSVVYLYIFN